MDENIKFTKHRKNKYITIDNTVLQDVRLSYDAVGILVYLQSHLEAFIDPINCLKKYNNASEDSIKKALTLLRECDYIEWEDA